MIYRVFLNYFNFFIFLNSDFGQKFFVLSTNIWKLYEGLASEDDVDLVVEKNILVEKNGKSKTISYCLLTDSILFWLSSSNKKTPTKSPSNLFGKSKVYGLFKLKDLVSLLFYFHWFVSFFFLYFLTFQVISPKEETKIETSFENKVQTYSFNTPVERQSFLEIFEKTKSACLQNSFMDPNATGTIPISFPWLFLICI